MWRRSASLIARSNPLNLAQRQTGGRVASSTYTRALTQTHTHTLHQQSALVKKSNFLPSTITSPCATPIKWRARARQPLPPHPPPSPSPSLISSADKQQQTNPLLRANFDVNSDVRFGVARRIQTERREGVGCSDFSVYLHFLFLNQGKKKIKNDDSTS